MIVPLYFLDDSRRRISYNGCSLRLYHHALLIYPPHERPQTKYLSMSGKARKVGIEPLLYFLSIHLRGGVLIACQHYCTCEDVIRDTLRSRRTELDFIHRTSRNLFSSVYRRQFNLADGEARKSSRLLKAHLENGHRLPERVRKQLYADEFFGNILRLPQDRILIP